MINAYTDLCKLSHGFWWMYKWHSRAWRHGILLWSMHENRWPHRRTCVTRTVRCHDTIWRPITDCIRCLSPWPPWHVLSYWMRLLFNSNRRPVCWAKLGEFSVVVNSRGIQGLNGVWASIKSKSRVKSLHVPVKSLIVWLNFWDSMPITVNKEKKLKCVTQARPAKSDRSTYIRRLL